VPRLYDGSIGEWGGIVEKRAVRACRLQRCGAA
jgi:hypothetical protein